jgi:hypothetical protein
MSTKKTIYHNKEFELYSDCFDEDSLFIKIKRPVNFEVNASNLQSASLFQQIEITAETDIEVFKEVAVNFLKWYDNEYVYPIKK